MIQLNSFADGLSAVVIGASGGIGSAISAQLTGADGVSRVYAFSRSQSDGTAYLDLDDESSIADAASSISTDLDLVIVTTGILHQPPGIQPEKSIREWTADAMTEVFRINAVGPALIAKHFLPKLRSDAKSVFAALSARVGSISDNRLGGWASYRSSKAALNMLIRTMSIEHARRRPQSIVVGLHPGTVATPLSEPFTGRRKGDVFSPEDSAGYLLRVIDGLAPEDTGQCFAWDGQKIAA